MDAAPLELIVPDWPAPPNVRAAMTTRRGGVSSGPYASLNLGLGGDDPAKVAENRRRLQAALGLPAEPCWLQQVHGTTVVEAHPTQARTPPEGDASWTREAGIVSAVMAADCLPVLFCDDAGSVVAAAHAGWRGLAAGVLEATVRALPVPAERIMAWLGAAIGPESFEVGPEVRAAFVATDASAGACFAAGAGDRYFADLYGLARQRLARAGVRRVHGGGLSTAADPQRFFSYRRDGRCGRMAALVWRVGDASERSRE